MRNLRWLWLLALALLAGGCLRRVPGPTEALDDAARDAQAGSTAARTLALAGWRSFFIDGDPDAARALFDRALGDAPGEPWALAGHATLAERSANPKRDLEASLELCQRAPSHPLCVVAARHVLELTGSATSLDQLILDRVPALLERGVTTDGAFFLRSALATVLLARGELKRHHEVLDAMGVPTSAMLVGPFSAWHVLSMAEQTPPEKTGSLEGLAPGPLGPLSPRTLAFADGQLSLNGEPATGDVYVIAFDFDVKDTASYVLRTVTSMDHVAVLDGSAVIERLTVRAPVSTLQAATVTLSPGVHRLLVRAARENRPGHLTVAVSRADGAPSGVVFMSGKGVPASWAGPLSRAEGSTYGAASALHVALADEAGDALARLIAARDGFGRDRDGARRLLAGLPSTINSPLLSVTRAALELEDRSIPTKVARGRATRELEAALARDKGDVQAGMFVAQLALDDGRQLDALEHVKTLRAATPSPTAPLLMLQARIELALGLDAQAVLTAREVETLLPGACDAVLMQYDVARRRDAVKEADALLLRAAACSGADARAAEHARTRGQLDAAADAWRHALTTDATQVTAATSLANLLVGQRKFDEAAAVLTTLSATWPRNVALLKQLADVLDHAGKTADALAMRRRAAELDGSDLSLRRQLARATTGKELLSEYAISTDEALKAYEAAPGNEEANAAFLLDAAAIRAYPDGSQIDRIHIIQKALDQDGVQEVAEVNLPQGAQVLTLRTLKADGTQLEPESIEGKETVSMPGVQVGDLVEYEYLLGHPPRGPGLPGFTASNFYFQVARQPNNWSTYTVIAPKGSGLKVDAHNMESPPPRVEGDVEVFRHEERRVAPWIPEPGGPPSPNEWLPFVSVGAGQTGNEGVVQAYADATIDHGQVTFDVEQFAKQAAGDTQGADAVRAVYVAVMEKLSGRDSGLGVSAAASVVQDRGSRTWLLHAALRALGFDVRLVAVRSFTADPAPYVFPTEAVLPYVCLRVRLPSGDVWLDTLVRYAPFGELPEFALGEREAYVLPEPGKPLERVRTPPTSSRPRKEVRLTLSLSEDGVLSGTGDETYAGFEAAQLAEALEALTPDQRDQALQQALSRYFGGADMNDIRVDSKRAVGATVHVTYRFTAPRFGRVDGATMVLGALTYPAMLGRRFLALSARRTPLVVEGSEASHVTSTLTLPHGWSLNGPVAQVKLDGPSGHYTRHEAQVGDVVTIDETLHVLQSRVAPDKYQDFGQFCGEVDLVQGRDLLVEKR